MIAAPTVRSCRRATFDATFPDDAAPVSGVAPSSRRAPLAPGQRLTGTPFIIVRLIGHGGMGEVYEVEHAELGRRAALKALHPRLADRPDLVARMRDEARFAAKLRHPNLVDVFDLGITPEGRPWFAMPLLHGRDLRDELSQRGPLAPRAAIDLITQALDGLAIAHAAGIVHRDVKLENLFLEHDGTVKVLDFGIAKITRDGSAGLGLTDPASPPGTPRSMAPEQCEGLEVDARADLYAMGLALYELVTGHGPFDDLRGNEEALRFAHCVRDPIPPSRLATSVSEALDAVILRALAKAPEDRFQSATEMAVALRRLLADDEPRACPPPHRAHDPWIAVTASLLSVAIFALGLAFGRTIHVAGTPDPTHTAAPSTKL